MVKIISSEQCALAMVNWAPLPFQRTDLDLVIHTLNMLQLWTASDSEAHVTFALIRSEVQQSVSFTFYPACTHAL